MKRFTETGKWDDPWFRSLTGIQKLVFLYVIDRCNNAGFWEVDEESMSFHTKLSVEHISGAWEGLNRGLIGAGGWVWVRRFLFHQKNDVLNLENNAHKQIIGLLKLQVDRFSSIPELKPFLAPYLGLASPIGKGTVEVKEEVEKKEKVKKSKADQSEVSEFFKELSLPSADGVWFFQKCEGNGWMNGGKPIKDWKSTVRAWNAARYLPSQKNGVSTPVRARV